MGHGFVGGRRAQGAHLGAELVGRNGVERRLTCIAVADVLGHCVQLVVGEPALGQTLQLLARRTG